MRRRFNSTQRNYLIVGLCAILAIMGVGYAAFSSQLKITGTSNIDSTWSVKITSITPTDILGEAKDKPEVTTYTDTTATFGTSLKLPNDSITYNIVIENEGSLDAKLDTISKTDTNNSAISFETSGVEEGDLLRAGENVTMKVKVTYTPGDSQPTNLESNLKVELNYSQAPNGYVPPVPSGDMGGQSVELVESGDGLYEDSYEAGRYIYRGTNPNNYIEFNDELWRIVAKETDGTYKIIRNDIVTFAELGVTDGFSYSTIAFDVRNARTTEKNTYCDDPQYGCGVYAKVEGEFSTPSGSKRGTVTEDSTIKKILNDGYSSDGVTLNYYNTLSSEAKGQMTSHSFNIGAVEYLDESGAEADSISKNIAGEKRHTWTGNVGLANVSDILKASTNPSCTSASKVMNEIMSVSGPEDISNPCTSNYLLFDLTDPTGFWSINAFGSESGSLGSPSASTGAWRGGLFGGAGYVSGGNAFVGDNGGARPVLYLKSDTTLSGEGTQSNPYIIV